MLVDLRCNKNFFFKVTLFPYLDNGHFIAVVTTLYSNFLPLCLENNFPAKINLHKHNISLSFCVDFGASKHGIMHVHRNKRSELVQYTGD